MQTGSVEKRSRTHNAWQAVIFASSMALVEPVLAHDGIGAISPLLESADMERAVAAGEWLIEQSDPKRVSTLLNTDSITVIEMLFWMAGADEPAGSDEFSVELTRLGYGDTSFAANLWVEEFIQVLAAYNASLLGINLRTSADIEAEINTLPTVPLDEAGVVEREKLMYQRILAETPIEERDAVSGLAARIEAVLTHVTGGGDK